MLDFLIFAATFLVALLAAVIYLYPGSKRVSSIPGLDPTTKEDGNLADIKRAGSLHQFLVDLHKQYGDIASFWMGKTFAISICSPELFKEHQAVFDRPVELFLLFESMIGPKSIQYANKSDGRKRRQNYDRILSSGRLPAYYPVFQEVADGLSKKWSDMVKEEHIPLSIYMSAYALKIVLHALFGNKTWTEKEILDFRQQYDIFWGEMERSLTDPAEENSTNVKAMHDAEDVVKKMVKKAVEQRKKLRNKGEDDLLVDALIDNASNEEECISDAITYTIGGFHTTGNVLTWGFYFLATHQDVQEKVYKEIVEVLGKKNVDENSAKDLIYLKQVIDETMRCAVVAPWAARFQDFDSELGGHKVPKDTPVIHALGVSLQNERFWPLPNKFDPDRFSPENTKSRPTLAYQPFGFAGKRICPGYRFAYAEATVCFVTLLQKFKLKLVQGQVVNAVYGLVTHPEEEIWITIEKR